MNRDKSEQPVKKEQARVTAYKAAMLEALQNSRGVVTTACEASGVPRSSFYRYMEDDTVFAEAVKDIDNTAIDFVENKLFQQIETGNTACIIFFLKTRAKHRGYVEKTETEHSGSVAIEQITGIEIK